MVCVKGIQNKPQTQEFYRAGTASPGFEIPGSATKHILFKVK